MSGGALVNKATQSFTEDYMIVECTDHTDSFYQFHLDNTKMGDYEKEKDMTFSIDMQNDVPIDLIVFQFINGVWAENLYNRFLSLIGLEDHLHLKLRRGQLDGDYD